MVDVDFQEMDKSVIRRGDKMRVILMNKEFRSFL